MHTVILMHYRVSHVDQSGTVTEAATAGPLSLLSCSGLSLNAHCLPHTASQTAALVPEPWNACSIFPGHGNAHACKQVHSQRSDSIHTFRMLHCSAAHPHHKYPWGGAGYFIHKGLLLALLARPELHDARARVEASTSMHEQMVTDHVARVSPQVRAASRMRGMQSDGAGSTRAAA